METFTSKGVPIDLSEKAFGELRDSSNDLDDLPALKQRMAGEGYLLLRGLLDRDQIMDARRIVVNELLKDGLINPDYPVMQARANKRARKYLIREDLGRSPVIQKLGRAGRMVEFFTGFLGGHVSPFDYVWVRTVGPGKAERPHCDIVYMGRASQNLYTSWIPLGDVRRTEGALMILESSHLLSELKDGYWRMDVDRLGFFDNVRIKHGGLVFGGGYSMNPAKVQKEFGLRWLTTDFRGGDVLIFSPFTMHCTLDNASDRIRLTMDARYQLASEPVDERWVGQNPIAHSQKQFGVRSIWTFGKKYRRWLESRIVTLGSLKKRK